MMTGDKKILYIPHVHNKIEELRKYGFAVTTEMIDQTVRQPEQIEEGKKGRKIAQRGISEQHLLRVVYEEYEQVIVITTLYPGRRDRYESKI